METITSKNNQFIKKARSLQEKKDRDHEDLYLIEGIRLAEEAISAHIELEFAFVNQKILDHKRAVSIIEYLQDHKVPLYLLEDSLFSYCANTVNPQGVLLVAKKSVNSKDTLLSGGKSFWLLADNLQDPGNLGTILRTGWAAGADGVILLSGGLDQYNPKVVRSSMGAVFNLPVYIANDYEVALKLIREADMNILLAPADGNAVYDQADLKNPLVWVLGSEAHGADDIWRKEADYLVSLPMYGRAESLNVAVAGGILLYETLRQRKMLP
jgi:TrmH family RNA methyltransferase